MHTTSIPRLPNPNRKAIVSRVVVKVDSRFVLGVAILGRISPSCRYKLDPLLPVECLKELLQQSQSTAIPRSPAHQRGVFCTAFRAFGHGMVTEKS
jgi:hypothetical protein